MENMKLQIKELSAKIEELQTQRNELRQRLAEAQSPFKIGDRVTKDGGKTVVELTSINPGYGDFSLSYFGAKIKKDGTLGAVISRIYLYGNEKIELA